MANPWHCYFAHHYDAFMNGIEHRYLNSVRQELFRNLSGRTLEIGAGTGVNVPLLQAGESFRLLTEPDDAMRSVLKTKFPDLTGNGFPLVGCTAENIPVRSASFDTVISTLVLCSVQDPVKACQEIGRVLRPGGKLLFIEHVRGNGRRASWQDRLQPLWSVLGCGCHPNRETVALITRAGFRVAEVTDFDPFEGASRLTRTVGSLVKPFVRGVAVRTGRDK